jgi:3',5'-cyclic AMP phosphodiesterase CpdA
MRISRRDILRLAGVGGIVYSTGLPSVVNAFAEQGFQDEFFFVQLSDTHWGFNNAKFNPDSEGTLREAMDVVNSLDPQPDFIVFTGDLTHTTDDPKQRRSRMTEFRNIVAGLKNQNIFFLPGEHDASLDGGEAYREFFGDLHYSFDHKDIHFIALDNVSDPRGAMGDEQLSWLAADLKRLDKTAPIIVLTHRPLFDLAPQWGWATKDGAKAIELLMPFENVTVFYGHIHQEHHHKTGHIPHHSAKSLIFPLSEPGSGDKKHKIAWDPAHPYDGLGLRSVRSTDGVEGNLHLLELPVTKA